MLESLSYRIKVPLNISLVIVATVVVITLTVLGYSYRQVDREMLHSGESLGRVLAKGVSGAMLRDDLWAVWDTIRTPTDVARDEALRPDVITVTDASGKVFASTAPTQFRILSRPSEVDARYPGLTVWHADDSLPESAHFWLDADSLLVLVPVLMDGSLIGTVLMEYRRPAFLERFGGALGQVALSTALILALVLPIGWWMGMRVARPLQELAGLMDRIGSENPRSLRHSLEPLKGTRADEIDRLRGRFHQMLGELADKEGLEREMVRADRLAAIGRLTAGIAHEINNPLGGMLNAVSNHRRRGLSDPATDRTLSLLERGLNQIGDIVAALLVEARLQSHDLCPEDLADVETLVGSDIRSRGVAIDWSLEVRRSLPLPSTPVRQVLMNLALNAVQAAGAGGHVRFRGGVEGGMLVASVCNTGQVISSAQMERLFEPFSVGDDNGEGTGLGLWVTYQIVQQLEGRIDVRSHAEETCFTVRLPLRFGGGTA